MLIEVAVAKVGKYAATESGDTYEMVERPRGGLAFVLADGQSSGKGAKFISNLVSRKAIALLGEGVRDEAAAQAAHDYLFAYRGGRVSAALHIIAVDPDANMLRICRNTPVPVLVATPERIETLDAPSEPVGLRRETHPTLHAVPLRPHTYLVAATDGLISAGRGPLPGFDLRREVVSFFEIGGYGAERLADALLARALELDEGRPKDDISVLVLGALPGEASETVRRMSLRVPYGT